MSTPTKTYEDGPVITFSHFLPRTELLPPRTFIKKSLPLVVGSLELDEQIRAIGSHTHICGHTHYDVDKTIGGIRYVQHALAHPNERKQWWKISLQEYSPKLLYDSRQNKNLCTIM